MLRSVRSVIAAALLGLWACGGARIDAAGDGAMTPADGGETDAGDAGKSAPDAGADAGLPDAGGADAGPGDAGEADAGPPRADVPAQPCSDSPGDVYVTPNNLPPMTESLRGEVVRCALDVALDLPTVSSEVTAKGITAAMTSAVTLYRIAFRTERGDGSAGVSTARVYLPQAPRPLPMPLILIGHPTVGLADACAPSMDPASNQDLALPWAGLGFAVIVPDYAGLGNEGTQGYLDNRDTAQSLLDGARALRKLLAAGVFSSKILASGFSQGGGATLSAQALFSSYGADGELAGAIVFAPEWPSRLNSFGLVSMLENPTELTIETGISENVVSVLRWYAYFANYFGEADAGDGFPAADRTSISAAVNSLCETPLGGYLQGVAAHVGDTMDPTLRTTLLACVQGSGQGANCVDPGLTAYQFLSANLLNADPQGAPILYVQGLADYVMPAASEAACNLVKLHADGVDPQVCVDALAQHQTVVARNMDFVLGWGQALLGGQPLPSCSSAGMPVCTP